MAKTTITAAQEAAMLKEATATIVDALVTLNAGRTLKQKKAIPHGILQRSFALYLASVKTIDMAINGAAQTEVNNEATAMVRELAFLTKARTAQHLNVERVVQQMYEVPEVANKVFDLIDNI